ncbi:hypothetical protein [Thermaurantiacus sp.]|uniref:hypothetical protein n=1 Tax=Thermaurantiacus sp. TaxID=2820283 RepID=UPI00298F04B6|nr:hypothetical protein [Thermaurantiacus sp.]
MVGALVMGWMVEAALSSEGFDPLAPRPSDGAGPVSPLMGVVVASGDPDRFARLLSQGLGLQAMPGAPGQGMAFVRPGVEPPAMVYLEAAPPEAPARRPGYDAAIAGPLAAGFAVADASRIVTHLEGLGVRTTAGVVEMTLPDGQGGTYRVREAHVEAPDGVLFLGIDRGTMTPVSPIDSATGVGGPAYASAVVTDRAWAGRVLTDVLGYERRRAFAFRSSGLAGGLNLPEGTPVTLEQWFAPGARTGYLVLLDVGAAMRPGPAAVAMRGIQGWLFTTDRLDAALDRARALGLAPPAPRRVRRPGVGCVREAPLPVPGLATLILMERAQGCP